MNCQKTGGESRMTTMPKPIVLIILDGWGYRESADHNPLQTTDTPTFDALFREHPHTLLEANGKR